MNGKELVIVNVNEAPTCVECLATPNVETAMAETRERYERDLRMYRSHLVNYPDMADQWQRGIEKIERAELVAMTIDEFLARQREYYLAMPVQEVTEELYYEMLDILPPLNYGKMGGYTLFCMSEFTNGVYTGQYAKIGDKYYYATVDAYDQSTWIPNRMTA